MKHNHKLVARVTSSLARRAVRLTLLSLLICSLLGTALAQNANRGQKVPPRTPAKPQVKVEEKTGVENDAAVKMKPGTGAVTGKVTYLYKGRPRRTEYFEIFVHTGQIISPATVVGHAMPKASGYYFINNLPPGTYRMDSDDTCFRYPKTRVTITAGKVSTINFNLHWVPCVPHFTY
jgi:hypothetical protein